MTPITWCFLKDTAKISDIFVCKHFLHCSFYVLAYVVFLGGILRPLNLNFKHLFSISLRAWRFLILHFSQKKKNHRSALNLECVQIPLNFQFWTRSWTKKNWLNMIFSLFVATFKSVIFETGRFLEGLQMWHGWEGTLKPQCYSRSFFSRVAEG